MLKKHLFLFSPDGDPGGAGEGNDPDPDESGTGDGSGQEASAGSGSQGDTVPLTDLNKANREAAKYRRERNDLQKRLDDLEGKDKSELERERERAVKAEAKLKSAESENNSLRVQVLASKVGIIPEARQDAARLLDWDAISDPSDSAEVEAALRDLVKDKPFLLGNVPGGSDAGAGSSREGSSEDMNSLLRAAAGRA